MALLLFTGSNKKRLNEYISLMIQILKQTLNIHHVFHHIHLKRIGEYLKSTLILLKIQKIHKMSF